MKGKGIEIKKGFKWFMSKFAIVFCMALMFGILGHTNVQAATVGQQLTTPESGWTRYDDKDSRIIYIGDDWKVENHPVHFNGSIHYTYNKDYKIKFKFKGNKLRLLTDRNINRNKDMITVYIDNMLVVNYNTYGEPQGQTLMFEKLGLENKEHSVMINNNGTTNLSLDAIDIDDTGKLLSYDEDSTDTEPVITGNRGFLTITMTNGQSREYDLSMNEINEFTQWYDNRDKGNGNPYYTFNKNLKAGAFTKRVENLVFDKISQFDIDEYDKK